MLSEVIYEEKENCVFPLKLPLYYYSVVVVFTLLTLQRMMAFNKVGL